MSQPKWRFITNLGDVEPLEHGGVFVYHDTTNVYDPEVEVLESVAGDREDEYNEHNELVEEGNERWEIYRFPIPKCTYENGVLSDNRFHPDHPAWFANDIDDVASFIGQNVEELIEHLCGDDIPLRAMAYKVIADYHGIINFDGYPLTFDNRPELRKRYNYRY